MRFSARAGNSSANGRSRPICSSVSSTGCPMSLSITPRSFVEFPPLRHPSGALCREFLPRHRPRSFRLAGRMEITQGLAPFAGSNFPASERDLRSPRKRPPRGRPTQAHETKRRLPADFGREAGFFSREGGLAPKFRLGAASPGTQCPNGRTYPPSSSSAAPARSSSARRAKFRLFGDAGLQDVACGRLSNRPHQFQSGHSS